MKFASDFRRIARDSLRGRWGLAVLAGFIASLLGAGTTSGGINFNFNVDETDVSVSLDNLIGTMFTDSSNGARVLSIILGFVGIIFIVSLVVGIVMFVITSVVQVGYSRFNLELVDKKEPAIGNLFSYFGYWKTTALASFLSRLYIFLWSLLFVIPGIIASYSYAMIPYILADNPEISASEAIERSKQMMQGNRWRLFCLQISFIGWEILCVFTLGIGMLWLVPYMNAATAEFYRDVSKTRHEFNEAADFTAEETYVVYE